MKALSRSLLISVVVALVLTSASVAVGIETHPAWSESQITPLSPNAIVQQPNGYTANNTCVSVGCHGDQADQVNNNHGMTLRPIPNTTASNWTFSTYTGFLPGTADFKFSGGAEETTASWVLGGMSIGSEMYIYQSGVQPIIGNTAWVMDYNKALPRGSFVPGFNGTSQITSAYAASFAAGLNYFTGTTGNLPSADTVGCVKCHAYGSSIAVDGGGNPTEYRIQEWGVTCINCHGNNVAQTHAAGNPVPFNSDNCYYCHDRRPYISTTVDTSRTQQIPMEVWSNGAAKDNYMQGYELRWSPNKSGHTNSIFTSSSTRPQACYRCHDAKGYMSHAQNGTDVPYFYPTVTGMGMAKLYPVTKATATGVDCAVCHTVHEDEQGLNQFGNRIPVMQTYDAAGPADPEWRQCSDCHRVRLSIDGSYSYVGYGQTIPLTNSMRGGDVHGFGNREMFLGYGGYGVANNIESTHRAAGVWCQYCHMPNSVDEPTADRSHLFKIVMPEDTKSSVVTTYAVYPGSASGSTTPDSVENGRLPDDSCTGSGCHLPSQHDIDINGLEAAQNAQKDFLQGRIDYWQEEVSGLIADAEAAQAAVPLAGQSTDAYKMASTNLALARSDGSEGVHNFNYSVALLTWAIQTFEDIQVAQPTALSIAVSDTSPAYDGSVTITGDLTSGSDLVPNMVVLLQAKTNASAGWSTLVTLGSTTGEYTYTATGLQKYTQYRFVYNGVADKYIASMSSEPGVKPHVKIMAATPNRKTEIIINKNYSFFGSLNPQYPAGATNVWIQTAKKSGGTWGAYNSGYAATNSNDGSGTKYSKTLKFTSRTNYRTRAWFKETADNAETYSGKYTFFVDYK